MLGLVDVAERTAHNPRLVRGQLRIEVAVKSPSPIERSDALGVGL